MIASPFSALVPAGDGLSAPPAAPEALRNRMAEVYGVDAACLLPVAGAAHGALVICRMLAADGVATIDFGADTDFDMAARLAGIRSDKNAAVKFISSPGLFGCALKVAGDEAFLVVDERYIEFADNPSLASQAVDHENLMVLRDLSCLYGIAGAPVGAVIANPKTIERLSDFAEPWALSAPVVNIAMASLDASRLPAIMARIDLVKVERTRLRKALAEAAAVESVAAGEGPAILIQPADADEARRALARWNVPVAAMGEGTLVYLIGEAAANDRLLAAFGVSATTEQRIGDVIRDTNETKIVARINLDAAKPVSIATGVPYFDHMLEQVAAHGGFSLALSCRGDTEVDAHHTVEDCAIALGAALSKALGAKRGIARYGFTAPMDEAIAEIAIDLSGRPYLVFEGAFEAPLIGDFPTEMTEHVFRSLSQHLGASIHVRIKGENDHHKTEAAFKALGRALRQAVRREGEGVPSTKGVL